MAPAMTYAHPAAACLHVGGEDAASFLQSQASADLRALSPQGIYTLWLSHQARIVGDSWVFPADPVEGEPAFWLLSAATPANALRKHFEKHLVADEVDISDHTAGQICHWRGEPAAKVSVWRWSREPQAQEASWSSDDFHAWRVEQSIRLVPQDVPELTPFEADLMDAVSLRKGCFLGQEVVARSARLERKTRQVCRFRLEQAPPPSPERARWAIIQGDAEVGALTSVAGARGLGWIKSRALASDLPLILGGADPLTLTVEEL